MYRLIAKKQMRTMNQIQCEINALEAEKFMLLEKMTEENILTFITEVKNLKECCGDGFRSQDYYAPNRYYSNIPGIKNLRFAGRDEKEILFVKVYSRRGKDLVEHIKEYCSIPHVDDICIIYSDKYDEEIDY